MKQTQIKTTTSEEASHPFRDRSGDKALLVGIQYSNPEHDGVASLYNPHQDVKEFSDHLIKYEGYQEDNVTLLLDEEDTPVEFLPTKNNIVRMSV